MLTDTAARDRAVALVERARRHGADAADAVYAGSESDAIQVRMGKLEDVERSENEHVDLRVFVGRRSASIGSSDLGDAALDELAIRAVAMARAAPEDAYAGLAPKDRLATPLAPDLDLVDAATPDPASLREQAAAAEDAARAVAGVTNSEGASASAGRSVFGLATSDGFAGSYGGTSRSLSAMVVAGEGGGMQRDYAFRSARHAADLPAPAAIGRLAGERAVARLDPGRAPGGQVPVVFDPRIGGTLIGHLVGAMSGGAIARRASFLLDREGERLFAPGTDLIDDPLVRRGLRTRPFDGEGTRVASRELVSDGLGAGGWLLDSASARQLGREPTGQAVRGSGGAPGAGPSNLYFAAGTTSVADLIGDIADGVYVTELIGHGVNGVTGDYSRGAVGFRILGGAIAGPIEGFTIAGNLLRMFAALTPANDLESYRAINVPTIRIDGMTIAGD